MDHSISSERPHADVRRAVAAELLALANDDSEPPLSIADTLNGPSWLGLIAALEHALNEPLASAS